MSELSASAREIIAGRNADPFHYLGPHTENDHTVVRVFLPDASRVFAISNGHERELERIDPAGLFAGPLDDPGIIACARASATTRLSWRTPIASRRCSPISISIS